MKETEATKLELQTEARDFLAAQGVDTASFQFLCRTRSTVDVGFWLGKRRIWFGILPGQIVLFALGKRPYFTQAPISQLHLSRYNHVTGELLLAPYAESSHNLAIQPREAYLVLQLLGVPVPLAPESDARDALTQIRKIED